MASPKTVLYIDDDPGIRRAYAELMEDHGLEVWQAKSGADALAVLHRNGLPDLMLVDYHMPGANGEETVLALRAQYPALSGVYTVGLTGFQADCEALGSFATLVAEVSQKPNDFDEFTAFIARLLAR